MPGAAPSDLTSVPLFDSLSDSERAEVAAWFEVREVEADVRLVGEGATGYSFFVIDDGEVAVTVTVTRSPRSRRASSSASWPCSARDEEPRP